MKSRISKSEAKKEIEKFFLKIEKKTPGKIKKIKRFAMKYNIPLKEKRKLFCGKCLVHYKNPKIRIKNKFKLVTCLGCKNVSRWKL